MALTKAQRARLEKLATYLEGLPRRTRRFSMRRWVDGLYGDKQAEYALKNGGMCGTSACAAGYGPAAGILVPPRLVEDGWVNWESYCKLFVGDDMRARTWVFNGAWGNVDNTPHGAAARIRYLLANGAPPEGFNRRGELRGLTISRSHRKLYAPYRIDAKTPA